MLSQTNGESIYAGMTPCEIVRDRTWNRFTNYSPLLYNNTAETIQGSTMELQFSVNNILIMRASEETIGVMSSSDGKIRKVRATVYYDFRLIINFELENI